MRRCIVLALIFLIAGCATLEPTDTSPQDTSFFLGRYDKVWEATMKVLEKRSIEVKDIDKENGTITTRFFNYSVGPKAHHDLDKIADRPQVRLALFTQVGYSLQITLLAVNDMSTQVKVKASIEAYDSNATKKWHPCTSKGTIEQEIIQEIKRSL